MAWWSSNETILRRWSSHTDRPCPDSFADFSDRYLTESMAIRTADPDLVAIMNNTASGDMVADVLSGKWDIVAPTEQQQAEAAKQAEIQRLFDAKPFHNNDLTGSMKLRMLSPDLAAQEEQAAIQQSGRAGHTEKEMLQMEQAQKEARHASLLKGMGQAQGETQMRLRRQQLLRQHFNDVNAQIRK